MSVVQCNDHGLLRRGHKVKAAERDHKRRLKQARERLCSFISPAVSDSDKRILAEVFVKEENALLLCEGHHYQRAICLLQEQQERNALVAAEALTRLLREGVLAA